MELKRSFLNVTSSFHALHPFTLYTSRKFITIDYTCITGHNSTSILIKIFQLKKLNLTQNTRIYAYNILYLKRKNSGRVLVFYGAVYFRFPIG